VAAKFDVNVFPSTVYADFETAIHNAVMTVWLGCDVKACRFHLVQSWWRKIQSLGLSVHFDISQIFFRFHAYKQLFT
jgi:hypothetical protein